MHWFVTPKILYFGTPVVLVSTLNEDGSANLAPMSSAWWLGSSCMLGLSGRSKTVENLRRERVLSLPSAGMVEAAPSDHELLRVLRAGRAGATVPARDGVLKISHGDTEALRKE